MNTAIFSADLSTLQLNNNCLVKTLDITKNVANVIYTPNYTNSISYTKYTGMDSSGNDIKNNTLTGINDLKNSCNNDQTCRGFNTSGWIKNIISNTLTPANSDLYVRNPTLTLGATTYTNTLNIANSTTNNVLIFSYIYIPNDRFYKFRIITTNNALYQQPCRIYLNNFQSVIYDSYISKNPTEKYELIKKGIYMICIDLPKNVQTGTIPVSFEFDVQDTTIHPDRITALPSWKSLNNLLIKDCNTLLTDANGWTLINLFSESANNFCKQEKEVSNTNCINYATTIPNYILNDLNNKNLIKDL